MTFYDSGYIQLVYILEDSGLVKQLNNYIYHNYLDIGTFAV